MGKFTRGGYAVLAAGAMVLTPLTAMADVDPGDIEIDGPRDSWAVCDAGGGSRDGDLCGPEIYRFAGPDRVATAIEAAKRTTNLWGYGPRDTPKIAIIANTEVFADALAATPLADELDAPVLLSAPGNAIDARVMAYLTSNGFDGVILAGGKAVFGDGVVNQLNAAGFVTGRVSGANRYQTAVQLAGAAQFVDYFNDKKLQNSNVFIASGENFPDALVSGTAAAHSSGVVVLVHPDRGLDEQTYDFITGEDMQWEFNIPWFQDRYLPNNHTALIAVGGPAERGLNTVGHANATIEPDDTVVGSNRYATATMLNQAYVGDVSNYVIASGENFPDGVVAGAYAANVDGGMLLTYNDNLPRVVEDFFTQAYKRETIDHLFVFGGAGSVAPSVSAELANLPWDY